MILNACQLCILWIVVSATYLCQMITIQSLENLAESSMAVVLFIPHVLVVLYLSVRIERERD